VESLRNAGLHCAYDTIRYDTRCYFNVSSKADMSQFNYYHYYVLYYAIMVARHTVQYAHIQSYMQIHPLKRRKKIKTVKRNRTEKTRATLGLLYSTVLENVSMR